MPKQSTADVELEEFRTRVKLVAEQLGVADAPRTWFAEQCGRTRSWIDQVWAGHRKPPTYAVRVLEAQELRAEVEEAGELLPAKRRKRAAELANELHEIRQALKTHLAGVLETLERGEKVMRRLSGEQKEITFGDREGNEDEARRMTPKGG